MPGRRFDHVPHPAAQGRPERPENVGAHVELRLEQLSDNSNSWKAAYKHVFTNRITSAPDFYTTGNT